jgi:hypothetical protein
MRLRTTFPAALMFLSVAAPLASAQSAGTPVAGKTSAAFQGQILPMLGKYCTGCHSGAKPKGGLSLANLNDESMVSSNRKVWRRVAEYVESGDMPPEGKPKPSPAEVASLLGWITANLTKAECGRETDPGQITVRRLNRAEYNNTIRDLIGVDFRPADDFPSDDVGYGFDNIGDVLSLPPLLMEQYLAAAELIAEQAIVTNQSSKGMVKTWEVEDLGEEAGGYRFEDLGRVLASQGQISVAFPFPRDSEYILRARAFGQQAGTEKARMGFFIDGKPLKVFDVAAERNDPKVYETRVKLRNGLRHFQVGFLNDFYDPGGPPNHRDRNLVIDYLEIQGPVGATTGPLPESHKRIIFRKPTAETRHEVAREILERFASRAYRRPATAGEVGRLLKFIDLAQQNGDSFERGVQLAVEAVLVSPQFLFRVELDPRRSKRTKTPATATHPINDFELASRLSYFLWSSMPDDELSRLALENKLQQPDVLEKQVRRLLRDARSEALVENFAEQWLQIRNLKSANPSRKHFPTFDEPLRAAMEKETTLFFSAVMHEDRSILDLLDSDFTYLNERLAKHYGISSVKGDKFRRVSLRKTDPRGGLLTQASILTVTSNPTRTSPTKRGKWILEQILGAPPPPPPPDVPELKEDEATETTGSLRKRMEQHRTNPSCASCHARLDPLGFGLENFDAVGGWRTADGPLTIDASGTLPSGQSFQGPRELKAILKSRSQDFTRCLTEKLLTYALGRGIEETDNCAVDKIVDAVSKDNYRFSRLVLEIVRSDPFRRRRNR